MSQHLLILDGSKVAEQAIPYAIAAARTFGAELHLLHVLESAAPSPQGAVDSVAWRMQRAEASVYLEAWKARIEQTGLAVTVEIREGRAAEQTIDVARSRKADLLVLVPRGAGAGSGAGLGDTSQKVIEEGCVSILLVRSPPTAGTSGAAARFRRVLVPLDASRRAECALQVATAIARADGATLLLAHVAPVPELPDSMIPTPEDVELRDRVAARNRERGAAYLAEVRARISAPDLEVTARVLVAPDVGRAICRSMREDEVDLVVTSAHGGGCRGTGAIAPYGGVARDLLSMAPSSIWILQDLPSPACAQAAPAVQAVFSSPRPEPAPLTLT